MSTQHTPGPWGIIKGDGGPIIFSGSNGQAVAQAVRAFSISERDANARLIAAAPDLLAVVKELQESAAYWSEYDVPIGIVDRINAAIAKATNF